MEQIARIKLMSNNLEDLENVSNSIKDMAEKIGVKVSGPIPLPTKKLLIVTRKAPSGEGTHTFDKWELRLHRRLIEVPYNDRVMAQITKLSIPQSVSIEIDFKTTKSKK
ncbi:MAG: 30S ribosomal protein S10 [Nitrososphaeria archaeon]|nr:30S ribosomal protein S10 [Conexivisphaerales archaeon]